MRAASDSNRDIVSLAKRTRGIGHRTTNLLLAATMLGLGSLQQVDACSRVLWNTNKLAVVVGRTMDWPESTQPILAVLPSGMKRDGGRTASAVIVKENPATWTSKYASLVTTLYGIGRGDGLIERGLGGHMHFP